MKSPHKLKQRARRMLAAFSAILLLTHVSLAQQAGFNWCFTPASLGVPTIDGTVDEPNELGWFSAFEYTFNNGTGDPDVTVHANASTTDLNLAVQVKNDPTWDLNDTILLAIGWKAVGTGSPDTFAGIRLRPLQNGGVATPPKWSYRPGSGSTANVNWGAEQADVGWLSSKTVTGGSAPNRTWDTEIKMTFGAAKLPVPSGKPLFFYFNVFRVCSAPVCPSTAPGDDGQVVQFPWPSVKADRLDLTGDTLMPTDNIDSTPLPSLWGKGIINSTSNCTGVNFSWGDISSTPAHIVANQPVKLTAKLHNNSGNNQAATNVLAVFRKAPYGVSAFNNWFPLNQVNVPSVAWDGPALGGGAGTPAQIDWTPICGSARQWPQLHPRRLELQRGGNGHSQPR